MEDGAERAIDHPEEIRAVILRGAIMIAVSAPNEPIMIRRDVLHAMQPIYRITAEKLAERGEVVIIEKEKSDAR
ncbi:hypothetical protein [Methanocalculus sp.]|uniref:hypothetical protein n=1 Tax=Methanocalculus sp. TaxID=2004547 RepID=UPI00262F7578|nr:hypothetical protein [Methanocalculus sp.]MDG6250855.1 hypothetical protein [Methanocalculus sp.]